MTWAPKICRPGTCTSVWANDLTAIRIYINGNLLSDFIILAGSNGQGDFFFPTVETNDAEGMDLAFTVFTEALDLNSNRPKCPCLDFAAKAADSVNTHDQEYYGKRHRKKQPL